jgi:hypothetical protein
MKRIFFIVVCLFCFNSVFAQKVLILENLSIGKSYKFFVGDGIVLKSNDSTKRISGKITDILDSSVVISNYYVFNLHEISVVYKERLGIQIVSSSLMGFGAMFFGLDVVNNIINNDHPTVRSDVAIISASVAAAGGILQIFAKRKCEIAPNKWRLKIIDQIHTK